jgi:hypothetical protein
MSKGGQVVTAIIGSVIVLAGTWYVLKHKTAISQWFSHITTGGTPPGSSSPTTTTDTSSSPSTDSSSNGGPSVDTSGVNSSGDGGGDSSGDQTVDSGACGPNSPPGTCAPSSSSDSDSGLPNVYSPETNPYSSPTPSNYPSSSTNAVPIPPDTGQSPWGKNAGKLWEKPTPSSWFPKPTAPSPTTSPPPPVVTKSTPWKGQRTPNTKAPRTTKCGDPTNAACNSKCVGNDGYQYMVTCDAHGQHHNLVRMGVERGFWWDLGFW